MRRSVMAACIALLAGCHGGASVSTLQPNEILTPLGLNDRPSAEWAASQRLYRYEQGAGWSPFLWADNTAVLSSIRDDPTRLLATAGAMLAELRQRSDLTAEGALFRFDDDFAFDRYTLKAPWRSAFAQAVAAIGLMHIQASVPHLVTDAMVDSYLAPIPSQLAHRDERGRLWFSEYVDEALPHGRVDVMNGHFFAIAAMVEWKLRTGTAAYDRAIDEGLTTMETALPEMIHDGYFSYAREYPQIKDYGQLRAVNFAVAACRLRKPICLIAQRYQALYQSWKAAAR